MENTETFIQWNVQGLGTSKEDLIKIVDEFKPSVIAVQETFYGDDFLPTIGGYNGFCKQGHYRNRFHGGVALYIHSCIPFQEITINSQTQIIAARIHINSYRLLTVASIYLPPRNNQEFENLLQCIKDLPRPMIVMGDFNAHHTNWGNNSSDRRGNLLQDFCLNNNLNIVNDGSTTHISGTAIDLTLVSPEITPDVDFGCLSSVLSSDHYPVKLTVTVHRRANQDESEALNFRKGDWKGYADDPAWHGIQDEDIPENPIAAVEELYSHLSEMAGKWIPKYKKRRFHAKPWWSREIDNILKKREKCYRKFKRTGEMEDKIAWKKARAIAKATIREAKKKSWRDYVSTLKTTTPSYEIWQTVNKIRGNHSRRVNILKEGDELHSSIPAISEKLAETFETISSDRNYSPEFLKLKQKEEKIHINFQSDNDEPYNDIFTINELISAVNSNRITTPGPDGISNLMTKHMPECALQYLLKIYNKIWLSETVYEPWKLATIIPIPKPGKDHQNPSNYRPISLTSCICKTYEKMINRRLTEYLENNKLFAAIQCGFRRFHSTLDHLTRFDTYLRKAIADGKHVMAVFFDLEKAYDMVWGHGVLKDLASLGLRGRLPCFIREFLKNRTFKVRLGEHLSSTKNLQTGTPQGSTLSVTLFAIKINSLAAEIPQDVFASLFVDDLLIAYADYDLKRVQEKMQHTINKVTNWAAINGARFSSKKSTMMHFYRGTEPPITPPLYMEGNRIPASESTRFLGLHWDRKLSWTTHINILKKRCMKDLNLMRTLSAYNWGADREILMRLYRTLIRPKIDYGCIVYGSANTTLLKGLEVIQNEAMRISTGALKSTPIKNLNILCNEPSLELRRKDLLLRYFFKLKCHFINPAYSCIVNNQLELFFGSRRYPTEPVIQRLRQAIEIFHIPIQPVLPYITPSKFSWTLKRATIEQDMTDIKKNELPPHIVKILHLEHMRQYQGYAVIYTDGSKTDDGVGSAAVMGDIVKRMSLPVMATVMTSELYAIKLALDIIRDTNHNNYVICSDSLSSIQCIDHYTENNHLLHRIMYLIDQRITEGNNIIISWVPSHVGIENNEKADVAAKEAARRPAEFVPIPYRDWFPCIKKRTYELWEEQWCHEQRDLQTIKPVPGRWNDKPITNRHEEVCLNRLRLEHTAITHGYLTNPDDLGQRPICGWCEDAIVTVRHILIECPALEDIRRRILKTKVKGELNMRNVLGEKGPMRAVLAFLQEINIIKFL